MKSIFFRDGSPVFLPLAENHQTRTGDGFPQHIEKKQRIPAKLLRSRNLVLEVKAQVHPNSRVADV